MVLKSSKYFLLFAGAFFFWASLSNAQNRTDKLAGSTGEIQFYLDKAVFRGDSTSYTEFYLMFYADRLKYDDKGRGEVKLNTIISDNSGREIERKDWSLEVQGTNNDTSLIPKVFYDQWNTYLAPGDYQLVVKAADLNSPGKTGELSTIISIPEFKEDTFSGSEIEFVSSISENRSLTQFKKGNSVVIPNPSRRYGILNSSLLFYYEVYGISGDEFKTIYTILSNNKKIYIKTLSSKFPGSRAAVVYGIDVTELGSGIYDLAIDISDQKKNSSTIKLTRKFEVIQGGPNVQRKQITQEEDEMYTAIFTIIAPEKLSTYKSLDSETKASFIVAFWKERDPSPGTAENEYMKEIQARFIYADQNFGWAGIKGWQSDMGKICIKYGIPDEIQQFNTEAEYLPYQIWYYKLEKEYQFVFGDTQSNGRFILLHSNKEGEISNTSWKELIQKM